MTVPSSLELLTHRLDLLRADRAAAMTATLRDVTGDVADRATNVEASIRLQLLDERIALLELEIDEIRRHRHSDGVVSVGDAVRVDLGDGPEEYVVGSVGAGRRGRAHGHAGQPRGPGHRRSGGRIDRDLRAAPGCPGRGADPRGERSPGPVCLNR